MKELLNFSIINIDKPSGPTSFSISDYVRKSLGLKKTSHFGTLDPKVTGVLPIALGRGCKLTGFFLGHDKTYVGVMHMHKEVDMKELQKIIDEKFMGKIIQLPPIKSRVKRAEREREIYEFKLLEQDGKDIMFVTKVQGGTYIRKLLHDLGEVESVEGAHMLELRRTHAGIFSEDSVVSLYDFDKAVEEYNEGKEEKLKGMLVRGEDAIKQVMPVVQVKKPAVKNLLTGKPLFKKDVVGVLPNEEVFAVFCGEKFIEIAEKTDLKGKAVVARALFVYN